MSVLDQNKRFVYRVMCAQCDQGNMEQYLNLPQDHGVYFQNVDQPLMNANDHDGNKHILQFGRCTSSKNPANLADTVMSAIPGLSWIDKQLDKVQEALGCDGCKCQPLIINSWKDGDEANRLDGAPAITNDSKVFCVYGGIITVKEMEANTEESQPSQESQEPQEKAPLDTLPEAMRDKILQGNANAMAEYESAVNDLMNMGDSLGGVPDSVMALIEGTEQWYRDNPTEFIDNYQVSEEISDQNYLYNSTQVIDPAALTEDGYIANNALLSNYNVANSTADRIGASCAASYNLMRAISDKPEYLRLSDVIRDMESIQTFPGIMDGGPLAPSMLSIEEYSRKNCLQTEMYFGNAILCSGETPIPGETGLYGIVEDGKPQFYTLQADSYGQWICLENPSFTADTCYKQSNENSMYLKVTQGK